MVENLIFEDRPRYDPWLKTIIAGVLAILFFSGVVLAFEDVEGSLVMFGVTVFDALLFKMILPQWFQVYEDKLRIVLGGPFRVNVPFSSIKEVRRVSAISGFVYRGIRFATSSRYIVEIVRKRGLNIVISPSSGDIFLEQANRAMGSKWT